MRAEVPDRFTDVSDFRQVPDNQEVFADAETDESIIIEILEMEPQTDEQALSHHFNDLAEANSAESRILTEEPIPAGDIPGLSGFPFSAGFLIGEQKVAKFRESAKNLVGLVLVLIRLPNVTTDLLISFNQPRQIDMTSSSWGAAPAPEDPVFVVKQFCATFRVEDWGLFG